MAKGKNGTPVPTPIPTGSNEPRVRYIGRFDFSDPAGPKFAWTGSTILARFKGSYVEAKIKPVNSWQNDNWLNVIIDGGIPIPMQINGEGTYILASDLPEGIHTVELFKRTEASLGELQFLGFDFGEGELLAPPAPSSRRIEFIGDSITAGYGNEAPNKETHFIPGQENGYMAYSAITARALGAEQHTVAWSGKGVYRDCNGATAPGTP